MVVIRSFPLRRHYNATTSGPRVEPGADRLVGVAGQVTVGAVDHLHAGAHDAGQLEDRDPRRQRLGGEAMAQLVGAAPPDPRRFERRIPLPAPPAVEPDVPAPGGGEDQRRVEPGREPVQGIEGTGT